MCLWGGGLSSGWLRGGGLTSTCSCCLALFCVWVCLSRVGFCCVGILFCGGCLLIALFAF